MLFSHHFSYVFNFFLFLWNYRFLIYIKIHIFSLSELYVSNRCLFIGMRFKFFLLLFDFFIFIFFILFVFIKYIQRLTFQFFLFLLICIFFALLLIWLLLIIIITLPFLFLIFILIFLILIIISLSSPLVKVISWTYLIIFRWLNILDLVASNGLNWWLFIHSLLI